MKFTIFSHAHTTGVGLLAGPNHPPVMSTQPLPCGCVDGRHVSAGNAVLSGGGGGGEGGGGVETTKHKASSKESVLL